MSDLVGKVSRAVKLANDAQTVSDVANELGKLDVDLPWRKRDIVETPEIITEEELEVVETEKSNLPRNILIGSVLGLMVLFFSKRAHANVAQEMDTNMQLTNSFKLSEFLVSTDIPEIKSYKLTSGEMRNVIRVATVLQGLRDTYGHSIFINSGGRPARLVARDGKYKGLSMAEILAEKGYSPSAHSQHMDFSAADFTVTNKADLTDLYKKIINAGKSNHIITQVILYVENGVPNFIHLGVTSDVNTYNISDSNRFLIAKVDIAHDENGKVVKRATEFYAYNEGKLNEVLV